MNKLLLVLSFFVDLFIQFESIGWGMLKLILLMFHNIWDTTWRIIVFRLFLLSSNTVLKVNLCALSLRLRDKRLSLTILLIKMSLCIYPRIRYIIIRECWIELTSLILFIIKCLTLIGTSCSKLLRHENLRCLILQLKLRAIWYFVLGLQVLYTLRRWNNILLINQYILIWLWPFYNLGLKLL